MDSEINLVTEVLVFGISATELVIILAIALLLLGPDQLPSVAKTMGKALREYRGAADDLKRSFERQMADLEREAPPQWPSMVAIRSGTAAPPVPPVDARTAEEPSP